AGILDGDILFVRRQPAAERGEIVVALVGDEATVKRYFPGDDNYGNAGSPTLTAYLLAASDAAGFTVPPDLAQRLERGLAAFAEGRIKPEHWSPQNDLLVRKLAAIEALTRRGQQPLSAISSLEIEPLRLPTSALIDWYLITKRLSKLPQRAQKQAAVARELRNRLSYLGARLVFTSERSDYWWWLMVSGDANAFRLIEAVIDDPAWKDDLSALVQGALMRQQRGRWLTTVANVWASIALDQFGSRFEKETVSGTTRAALGSGAAQTFAWLEGTTTGKLLLPWPSKPAAEESLQLAHDGDGQPWATMLVLAAVPVQEAVANGLRVKREVTPVQAKEGGTVSRGDVWRVRLTVESDQEMTWVVLNDPIPAGARILGEGDGRDSRIASSGETSAGHAWPAYVERTFSAYRAYYSYVPRGTFSIDYTLRLNNAGEFSLPATRVEAMYAPEVFGEAPNAKVVVGE
ncbi:MAG: S24 family peptidase, partial [Propionivibrio sp.]